MTDQQKSEEDTRNKDEATDFSVMLATLAKGKTNERLSEQLAEVVAAVAATKKAGKLSMTLQIKPQSNVPGAVIVTATSATKAPAFDPQASIFYATDDGHLVRDDPKQTALY